MPDEQGLQVSLTGKQRKKLRGLGHHLEPVVYVGRSGLTSTVIESAVASLKAHELIKVKLGQNCPLGKQEAAEMIAGQTGSALVQLIGKMVLLYQPNPDRPKDQRVVLPE